MKKTILRKQTWGGVDELVVTKKSKGNYTVKRNGKSLDKCSLSSYFKPCTYFNIYWYSANKNAMIEALVNDNNTNLNNIYKA